MKKRSRILLALLLVPTVVFALSTVSKGSVSLTTGKYDYSDDTKINYTYPFISVENNESTSSAKFSSVLSKKGLFGIYSDKQRLDKQSSALGDHSYFFSSAASGTYRISLIGESGTTTFDYAFTSSNSKN